MSQPQEISQAQGATTELQVPPVLNLRVSPQVFEVIRRQLGTLPHDQIGGLCQNLEAQVAEQIQAFNMPKMPPADPPAPPLNRAGLRSAGKKAKPPGKVTPLARAANDASNKA